MVHLRLVASSDRLKVGWSEAIMHLRYTPTSGIVAPCFLSHALFCAWASHVVQVHNRANTTVQYDGSAHFCCYCRAAADVPAVNIAFVHAPSKRPMMGFMRFQGQMVDRQHMYVAAVFFAL